MIFYMENCCGGPPKIAVVVRPFLLLDSFRFCETQFTTHSRFVANMSAISSFLGGGSVANNG